jgi:hypothetical protein
LSSGHDLTPEQEAPAVALLKASHRTHLATEENARTRLGYITNGGQRITYGRVNLIVPSRQRRTSSVEALVGAMAGRARLLLTLPPSSLFVAGRLGRGWLYVFCSDQRCSRGLVIADDRAIDRPSRLAPGPSRLASPSPLPPFARSSASGPPRRDSAARRARATVRASSAIPPPASLVRTSASGRRATPRHNVERPLRSALSLPPLGGSWASVVRAICAVRRPLTSRSENLLLRGGLLGWWAAGCPCRRWFEGGCRCCLAHGWCRCCCSSRLTYRRW